MAIEKYIVVKDRIIIKSYDTAQGIEGVYRSIGNIPYDSIIKVNIEGDHRINTHIDEYDDKDGKFLKMSYRVRYGYVKLPYGYKIDGEEIAPMTLEEKHAAGLITIDPMAKFIGNDIIPKTDAELIADGIKTQKEINDKNIQIENERLISEEIRKMAIERLGSKLK